MPTELKLRAGTLPTNCYPANPQDLYAMEFALGAVVAGDLKGVIISNTPPGVNDQDKGWVKTSGGVPTWPPIYVFSGGSWIAPHQFPQNSDIELLWKGTEASLVTFDGGDANPIGDASGAMWVVDHVCDGRAPMAPGVVPGKTIAPLNINVGDLMGSAEIKQLANQVAGHIHNITGKDILTFPGSAPAKGTSAGNSFSHVDVIPTDSNIVAPATVQPMEIMTPVIGRFIIKRSARKYYKGA